VQAMFPLPACPPSQSCSTPSDIPWCPPGDLSPSTFAKDLSNDAPVPRRISVRDRDTCSAKRTAGTQCLFLMRRTEHITACDRAIPGGKSFLVDTEKRSLAHAFP